MIVDGRLGVVFADDATVPVMTTARKRLVPTSMLVTACALAWLAALSGRIATWLSSYDALPEFLGWLYWPGGPNYWVVHLGLLLGFALWVCLAIRLARRWWIATLAVLVGVIVAFIAPDMPYPGARAVFAAIHPQLAMIATLPAVTTGPPVHDVDLPSHLAGVFVSGYVTTDGAGGVFVPMWAGVPDDAGGFWYTPGQSPEGRDMWGMECREPVRLDGDWWACGIDLEPAAPRGAWWTSTR